MKHLDMHRVRHILLATGVVVAFLAGAVALTPIGTDSVQRRRRLQTRRCLRRRQHNAEAAKYDEEAASLDAKAERHAKLASAYRARGGAGSKQSMANQLIDM